MDTAPTNAPEFSVSEISAALKRTVEDTFGNVRVRGEITGYRGPHSSGHAYFALKDDKARLEAVVWRGIFSRLRFPPEEGMEVIAQGKLTTYPGSSKYQIVIEQLEPAGEGALMAMLEQRRKKLLAEGLFEAGRKQDLPYLPSVIGVITSPTGAVIRDILHRLNDRFPVHVIVWPVRVQGETCGPEVTAAIEGFNAIEPGGAVPRPDLIIVARGGGSIEDLWGFNDESVVRAAAYSEIPLMSAVGHETDTTLIDYAADVRAPTPTGAAEMAVPVRAELIGYVDDLGGRGRGALRRVLSGLRDRVRASGSGLPRPADLLSSARQRHDLAAQRLGSSLNGLVSAKQLLLARVAPRLSAGTLRQRQGELAGRLARLTTRLPGALAAGTERARLRFRPRAETLAPALRRQIQARTGRLEGLGKLLASLGYPNVLARGFALVADDAGTLVRAPADAPVGTALRITLTGGTLDAVATDSSPGPAARNAPPKSKKSPGGSGGGQQSLF